MSGSLSSGYRLVLVLHALANSGMITDMMITGIIRLGVMMMPVMIMMMSESVAVLII